MASIARCIRTARPSALSAAVRPASVARATPCFAVAARSFSATAITPVRKYTKDHEWIDLAADNKTGVFGISAYAAEALGDVVYVELPEEGREVAAGDAVGAVESVKSAADINAPVSCTIAQANTELEEKPGTINKVPEDDSHGGGWIAKVVVGPQGVKDLEGLMGPDEYKAFTEATEADH